MGGFDRERVTALSYALEEALAGLTDRQEIAFRDQLTRVLTLAKSGALDKQVKTAPGMRHFVETALPGDPTISKLYLEWCRVIEGTDTERNAPVSALYRRGYAN